MTDNKTKDITIDIGNEGPHDPAHEAVHETGVHMAIQQAMSVRIAEAVDLMHQAVAVEQRDATMCCVDCLIKGGFYQYLLNALLLVDSAENRVNLYNSFMELTPEILAHAQRIGSERDGGGSA